MSPGLINGGMEEETSADPSETASTDIQDPVLKAAEAKIESSLTPQNRQNYTKILVAGLHIAMNGGPQSILYKLKDSKDPINDCALGAINLVLMMRKQARGAMPLKAMVPAAATLMIKALDFADKSGLVKVDNAALVKAMHIFTEQLTKAFGISQQMIHNGAKNVHDMTQNPVQRAALERASGARPN